MKPHLNKNFLQAKKRSQRSLHAGFFEALAGEDLNAVARALSLLESKSPKYETDRNRLLKWIYSQDVHRAKRIGITGSPGVGKSSFIEALGQLFCDEGLKIAVLSIDPSSAMSGGSILGDQTRMTELSKRDQAYIRPSPSSTILGGVAGATRESIALFEALSYDYILIETVGVGQSETTVAQMTDLFLLLLLPGAGDSLQGIKRGVVEMADIIAVNKADGNRKQLASETKRAYKQAIQLFPPKRSSWETSLHTISALERTGIQALISEINAYFDFISKNGYLSENRSRQALNWFDSSLNKSLLEWIGNYPGLEQLIQNQKVRVSESEKAPYLAAIEVIDWLSEQIKNPD